MLVLALALFGAATPARPVPERSPVPPPFLDESPGAVTLLDVLPGGASLLDEPPHAVPVQRGPVSLQEAQMLALQRFPGRVVRAETVSRGGRREHHIRILAENGRVRTVRIEAQTGRFL